MAFNEAGSAANPGVCPSFTASYKIFIRQAAFREHRMSPQMIEEHRCSMSQIGVVIAFTVQITAMIVEVVE